MEDGSTDTDQGRNVDGRNQDLSGMSNVVELLRP